MAKAEHRPDVQHEIERFTAACHRRGVPVTHQRLAVYRFLLESPSHPDAEAVFGSLASQYPSLSRGTVYRTLEMLLGLALVREVGAPGPSQRFEANLNPHHHLWCVRCRRISDVADGAFDGLTMPPGLDFEVTDYTIQFNGVCAECRSAAGAEQDPSRRRAEGTHGREEPRT